MNDGWKNVTAEDLRTLCFSKGISIRQLADQYGVSEETVYARLTGEELAPKKERPHGEGRPKEQKKSATKAVPTVSLHVNSVDERIPEKKVKLNRDELYQLYIVENKMAKEIGEMYGISKYTVQNWCRKFQDNF